MDYLPEYIAQSITEDPCVFVESDNKYFAAVAIIKYRNKWLLGLANSHDDRNGKWCMVGGHIDPGETPEQAAVREAYEEAGIKCTVVKKISDLPNKNGVAFVVCNAKNADQSKLKPNDEFQAMGWFTKENMRSLKLYDNVKTLIEKAAR